MVLNTAYEDGLDYSATNENYDGGFEDISVNTSDLSASNKLYGCDGSSFEGDSDEIYKDNNYCIETKEHIELNDELKKDAENKEA